MKYEEPMVEILIFQDDMDVVTVSESTGGLGGIEGEPGGDQGGLGDLL